MKRKINLFIFTLVLTAIFSIISACGRRGGHGRHSSFGHSSFGHSSFGHSSFGHSSSGHSSSGHSSSGHASEGHSSSGHASEGHSSSGHASEGHSSSGHASEGHIGSDYGNYGHVNSGNTGVGYGSEGHAYDRSHHSDGDSSFHYGPRGQNYHNSETNLESEGHHNSGSGGSGYNFGGGYHHYPHHHQAHGHYGSNTNEPISTTTTSTTTTPAPKIEESWLDLSCDNKLPKFMGEKYPKKKVEAVIQKMNSDKHSDQVKFEVQDYLLQLNLADFQELGDQSSSTTGCEEIKSRTAPLGGCDVKGQAFIIVNVPDLKQVVKITDCSASLSLCGGFVNSALCIQSNKEQNLLVLPAKREPYNISDLSVATFKFHDGCKCVSPFEINFQDLTGQF